MASANEKPKMKDFFNQFTNPSGAAPFKVNYPNKNAPPPKDLSSFFSAQPSRLSDLFKGSSQNMTPFQPSQPQGQMQGPMRSPNVQPSQPQGQMQGPLFQSSGKSFQAPAPEVAPEAPAQQVPPQWLKPDGSFYSPEEISQNIESTLMSSRSRGDIPSLAGNQFGGGEKSGVELQGEAARINNARNDIAVGANDPYKVASQSGIAYTAAELNAIEKAYAGVYDPALDTALAKVEEKQAEDQFNREAKLRTDLQANAPYTLGKDEVRMDGQGNPIAVGISSSSNVGTGLYTEGADPTVDAYIKGIRSGTYKPSDVPDEYKALVAQGMNTGVAPLSVTTGEAVNTINLLLESKDLLGGIAGWQSIGSFFPGDTKNLLSLTKRLQGIMSLENRNQLKGQGAISDFEFRVLGDASNDLGIDIKSGRSSLSNEEFLKRLEKWQFKIQVGETQLPDDELIHLRDKGYTPDQVRELNRPQSFNSAGNATASTGNRPQRNQNPGNVKSGGLADSLAIGTDDQDHLVFPDAATGFRALTMDLTAKINGGSRHLAANPTITQLGKVYAEDPNWPIKVSGMLGVSPSTPTKNIPISQLVDAIARQEGFYA